MRFRRAGVVSVLTVLGLLSAGGVAGAATNAPAGPVGPVVPVATAGVGAHGVGAGTRGGQLRTVRLYLRPKNPYAMASYAREVTDPASPLYGRFLSPGQFDRRFGPSKGERERLERWLTRARLHVTVNSRHYLEVTGADADLTRALRVTGERHAPWRDELVGPAGPAQLPASIAASVLVVTGLAPTPGAIPLSRGSRLDVAPPSVLRAGGKSRAGGIAPTATAADGSRCSDYVGQLAATDVPGLHGSPLSLATCPYPPALLRKAYGAGLPGGSGKGRTVAVVGAYGSSTALEDLDRFAAVTGDAPLRGGQYDEVVDRSGWSVSPACAPPDVWSGEQALDLDSVHGYAPDANILYVGADSCLNDDLFDAEATVIDQHAADIISNSWAEVAHADPVHLTPEMVQAWNYLFQQAAVEGIGVYAASGDCGDASPEAAATGSNCDLSTTGAQATFPGASPWVTSVGATTLATDARGDYAWETSMGDAVSIRPGGTGDWAPWPGVFAFGGGGGPGDAAQPWYQRGVVPSALSWRNGGDRRVTPDVAMEGDDALPVLVGYTIDGTFELLGFGGTSAATPAFAAIQADAEQAWSRTIGFSNPLLYSLSRHGLLNDVGAREAPVPAVVRDYGPEAGEYRYVLYSLGQDHGLPASSGYDSATGLGSPSTGYLRWFRAHG